MASRTISGLTHIIAFGARVVVVESLNLQSDLHWHRESACTHPASSPSALSSLLSPRRCVYPCCVLRRCSFKTPGQVVCSASAAERAGGKRGKRGGDCEMTGNHAGDLRKTDRLDACRGTWWAVACVVYCGLLCSVLALTCLLGWGDFIRSSWTAEVYFSTISASRSLHDPVRWTPLVVHFLFIFIFFWRNMKTNPSSTAWHLPAQEKKEIHDLSLNPFWPASMSAFRRSKNSKRSTESIYDMLQMVSQVWVCVCLHLWLQVSEVSDCDEKMPAVPRLEVYYPA